MRDSVDIFKNLVFDKINRDIKVLEVLQTNPNYQTIRLCSMKWIKQNSQLTFNIDLAVTNTVDVIEVIDYQSNIVKVTILDEDFAIKAGMKVTIADTLTFINGTRMVANNEWKLKTAYDVTGGLPLIWLHETIRENFKEKDNSIERVSTYRFFLLDEVDFSDLNEVKRAGAVRPMYGLLGELKRVMDSKLGLKRSGDLQVTSFSHFGTETQQGIRKNILDAHLGGLEVVVDLEIYTENCNC